MKSPKGAGPKNRYFVVHLQKTAGTTLRNRLRKTFRPVQIYPHSQDGPNILGAIISLSHLERQWKKRGEQIRLIAGHFPLSTTNVLGADFTTMSVLRPPLDRTLSYLRHQREVVATDMNKSFEEIYDDPARFHSIIRNHMTRMFGMSVKQMRLNDGVYGNIPDSQWLLERAKKGVESLDFVGLQPEFETFWQELSENCGFDKEAAVNSNATKPKDAPESLKQRIREDNKLDFELYDFAVDLIKKRGSCRRPGGST
ncbi:MAG: sulfotransferase family 2 domain-containing protein [Hellea sp.]|nr:sulfotransferase family 2 domain-containing protein [Hellea sp.]